jgi:hypothetical protein
MCRTRFILIGAVLGVAWASSLRGFMQQLAGPTSAFTFAGTFGIIIPAGATVGALLGWAEYQRRIGHQYRLLILSPLLLGIFPLAQPGALQTLVSTGGGDGGPIGLALVAMIGGYSVSGRGPRWARVAAGIVGLASVAVTFAAPKPDPDLSVTTAHGAWFATLAASLGVCLALASSIPMLRPETKLAAEAQRSDVPARSDLTSSSRPAATGNGRPTPDRSRSSTMLHVYCTPRPRDAPASQNPDS